MDDQRAFAEGMVSSTADVLAVVFADNDRIAEEALRLIEVTYIPMTPVLTPEEALAPGAPLVCLRTDEMKRRRDNVCHEQSLKRGDPAAEMAAAHLVVERTYRTQVVDPGFLEPESGLAAVDADGRIVVEVGTQAAFDDRRQLARLLAIPEERIIVRQIPTGGAFGGKEDIILHFALALGALRTGRTVKMVLSREESFRLHPKRHPVRMDYRTGFDESGRIVALEADIVGDTGCYASLGPDILENFLTFGAGPYEVPALALTATIVYTNNPPAGAMRGFGVPQVAFAVEEQMDEAAHRLGLDPIEIRLQNALREGSTLATGQRMEAGTAIVETLHEVRNALATVEVPPDDDEYVYGLGIASAMKNIGFGHGFDEEAGAEMAVTKDGLRVATGTFEYGQGSLTVIEQLAAESAGVPVERVKLDFTATELSPETGPTTASRQTFLTGNAVVAAGRLLRERAARKAAEEWGGIAEDWRVTDGRVENGSLSRSEPLFRAPFLGLASEYRYRAPDTEAFGPFLTVQKRGEARRTHWSYAYGTQAALVQVSRKNGAVTVLKVWAAQDCGRALNPLNVKNQIVGGVVQGVGYALSEEVVYENGHVRTDNFHTYRMPRPGDAPEVVPIIVEVPDPHGPYGAKGMGESPLLPTAPAVTNAIFNATGLRVESLPVDRALVKEALTRCNR